MVRDTVGAALLGLIAAGDVTAAAAAGRNDRPVVVHAAPGIVAVPADVPLDLWGLVRFRTPFTAVETPEGPALVRIPHYQGPDGRYDTQADFVDAINGTPCGDDCTARALARWGYGR